MEKGHWNKELVDGAQEQGQMANDLERTLGFSGLQTTDDVDETL